MIFLCRERFAKLERDAEKTRQDYRDAMATAATWKDDTPALIKGIKSLFGESNENPHTEIVKASLNLYQTTSKKADETYQARAEANQKLLDTVKKLGNLEIDHTNHQEVLKVIEEGLVAFGQLKKSWSELQIFFRTMSLLIKSSMGGPMKLFVEQSKELKEYRDEGIELSNFHKELINEPMHQAVNVSSLVHHLSGAYGAISKKHLMPMVANLGTLISLDKDKHASQIREEMNNINQKALHVSERISEIIEERREAHERQSHREREELAALTME
jgi:hypothetical protein